MKSEFIQKLKRCFMPFLCSALLAAEGITAIAESVGLSKNSYTYFIQSAVLNEGWAIHEGIFTVDGQPAYCIEPKETVVIGEDRYATGSWENYSGYGEELKKKITEYSWFGYGHSPFTDMESWYATQLLIWKAINPAFADARVYRDPSYKGDGMRSPDTAEITGLIQTRMNEIQSAVDAFHREVQPVFSDAEGNRIDPETPVEAGETIRVHDENGALQNYSAEKEYAGLTQNGNDLTIETSELNETSFVFRYAGTGDTITGAPLVLKAKDGSGIQTLIIRGRCDSREFRFSLRVSDAKLRLIKKDAAETAELPTEAELSGAVYEVRNETENAVCGSLTTGKDGVSEILSGLNVHDTYTLKETAAPKGYCLDEETHVFKLNELKNDDGIYEIEMRDRLITGILAIHKMIASRDVSDICVNEEGAHFAVLSDHAIRQYGSFENAYSHYDEIHELEKAKLITDKDGYAQSGPLAYGSYTVRQTKASSPDLELVEDFSFAIHEDSTVPLKFELSNLRSEYQLKIIKTDLATGKKITYHPAAFQIRKADGSLLRQKVGSSVYDTFMTASDKREKKLPRNVYADPSSEEGTLVLPLGIAAGSYELIETASPYGYAVNPEPLPFTVGHAETVSGEDTVIEVSFADEMQTGSLRLHKTIAETECDTDLLDGNDLSGNTFTLYAAEDILSCLDGSLLYANGDVCAVLTTDSRGYAEVSSLPFGHYILRETSAGSGLIRTDETWEVTVDEENRETEIHAENRPVTVCFSKKQASGEEELCGAHLSVTDADGQTVDEWISSETPHIICGLDPKQTYTLTETLTPRDESGNDAGYVQASSISFQPSESAAGSTLIMKDSRITVQKQDQNGEPLTGAHLCVLNESGETVDEWISSKEGHAVRGLRAGETYLLRETEAPAGYYLSHDIVFTPDDESDQNILMKDAPIRVQVRKIDENTGEDLIGAAMKLYEVHDEEETLLISWQTEGTPFAIGEYLKAGGFYRLEECEIVEGVYQAADTFFTPGIYDPEDEEPLVITVIDAAVRISALKTDPAGKPLSGAELCIEDESGTVIHEWISSEKPEDLSSYVKGGQRYVLRETKAPQGYAVCDPLPFKVSGNTSRAQMIRAVDRDVRIHLDILKTDSETETPLSDCEVTVYRASDNTAALDQSGKKAVLTTDEAGKASIILPYDEQGYYVMETKAPKGYKLNPERFAVSAEESSNPPVVFRHIHITNQKKTVPTGIRMSGGSGLLLCGTVLLLISGLCAGIGYCRSRHARE